MLEQKNSGHFHNQIGNHCNYFLLSLLRKKYMNRQECIPVGCVLPAAVAVTGGLQSPLGANPPEQAPPWSRHPPQSGPGAPPWPDSSQLPPWLWAWRPPPQPDTPQFPPGCGPGNLQGMLGYHPLPSRSARYAGIPPPPLPETCCKACWDNPPSPQRPAARHAGIPPLNRITNSCKNITFPQLRMRAVTKDFNCVLFNNTSLELFCNVYRYCEVWKIDDYGSRSSFVTIDVHPPSPKPASMQAAVMC